MAHKDLSSCSASPIPDCCLFTEFSYIQEKASKMKLSVHKVAKHAERSARCDKKLKNASNFKTAVEYLKRAHEQAAMGLKYQRTVEHYGKKIAFLHKKHCRNQRVRKMEKQRNSVPQVNKLKGLIQTERLSKSEALAERQQYSHFEFYDSIANIEGNNNPYDLDPLESLIHYDNGILPAACCYIPPARSQPNQAINLNQSACVLAHTSSTDQAVLFTSGNVTRNNYDVTAYGIPDPELDILIEGEMRNPICCMCCGLRWRGCDAHGNTNRKCCY